MMANPSETALVWQWPDGVVSGHTIRHLAAAAGATISYSLRKP